MRIHNTLRAPEFVTLLVIAFLVCFAGYYLKVQKYFYSHLLQSELTPVASAPGVLLWLAVAAALASRVQSSIKIASICFLLRMSASVVMQGLYYLFSEGLVSISSRAFVAYTELIDITFYYDRYVSMQLALLLDSSWILETDLSNNARAIRTDMMSAIVVNLAYAAMCYAIAISARHPAQSAVTKTPA